MEAQPRNYFHYICHCAGTQTDNEYLSPRASESTPWSLVIHVTNTRCRFGYPRSSIYNGNNSSAAPRNYFLIYANARAPKNRGRGIAFSNPENAVHTKTNSEIKNLKMCGSSYYHRFLFSATCSKYLILSDIPS